MKRAFFLISILILLFLFSDSKNENKISFAKNEMPKKIEKSEDNSLPLGKTTNSGSNNLNLAELEVYLQRQSSKNFNEFTSEELQILNQRVLQRAELIKKQIFLKAAQRGYYL